MFRPILTSLNRGSELYPAHIAGILVDKVPETIRAIGDIDILHNELLAFFCSQRTPGDLILKTYDWIRCFRDNGLAMISGFHSPMEKECLDLLLRGEQPIVICPARAIENMHPPTAWRKPIEAGRILILSPFNSNHKRVTADLAERRNEFTAAMADRVFIAHAAPKSRSETLAGKVINSGKPLFTFDSPNTSNLTGLGAVAIDEEGADWRCLLMK